MAWVSRHGRRRTSQFRAGHAQERHHLRAVHLGQLEMRYRVHRQRAPAPGRKYMLSVIDSIRRSSLSRARSSARWVFEEDEATIGFAVILSRKDGDPRHRRQFPEGIKIPADHSILPELVAAAGGRQRPPLGRGGIGEAVADRAVSVSTAPDPHLQTRPQPGSGSTPFAEAGRASSASTAARLRSWAATFELFLSIGYDTFYLTCKTDASVPKGRPVFPGVGMTTTAEAVMSKHGLVHKGTRMLDALRSIVGSRSGCRKAVNR